MYNSSVVTQKNIFRINQRTNLKMLDHKKALIFGLVLLIVCFGILYIVCINSLAAGGYKTQEYKAKLGDLKVENKMLELKLSEVKSFGYLEKRVEQLKMTEVREVEYVFPTSQVAAK